MLLRSPFVRTARSTRTVSSSVMSAMRGKRAATPPTPNKGKKARRSNGTPGRNQQTLTSFFSSPASNGSAMAPIEIDDGVDEEIAETDEDMARRLQEEWNAPDTAEAAGPSIPRSTSPKVENGTPSSLIKSEHPVDSSEKEVPAFFLARKGIKATASSSSTSGNGGGPSNPARGGSGATFDFASLDASIASVPLADDIFVFDPASVDTSSWPTRASTKQSEDVARPTTPYALLTAAFVLISATRSRITITTVLTNLLRIIRMHDPDSLLPTVYLISNHIAPSYDGIELGLGGSIVNKVIREVTGKSTAKLRTLWNLTGDPGDVAYEAKKDIVPLARPPPITVQRLFTTLHTIASISGTGSGAQKHGHVAKLLVASRGEETRFLVRTLHSHLRIQAVRTTIATAIARAFALVERSDTIIKPESASAMLILPAEREGLLAHPTKAKERHVQSRLDVMDKLARAERLVREVRARHPNFGAIVPALLDVGLDGLSERVPLRIGTPISPMLGSITRSLDAMHTKLGPRAFVSEFKYDGQRVQIHAQYCPQSEGPAARQAITSAHKGASKDKRGLWVGPEKDVYVRLFSRHLEDMTTKYPDICDLVPKLLGAVTEAGDGTAKREARSFIMDAEVVAMSPQGELLPFQQLANRSRKDVNLNDVKVRVGVYSFDLMYLDGASLLKTSFRQRRHLLHTKFPPLASANPLIARFAHVASSEETDPEAVAEFFALARASKCEGMMVKSLDHHWESAPVSDVKDEGPSGTPSLQKLEDVVGEDLHMEEDTEAIGPAAANDDTVGKGVNGRGKALLSTYEPDKRCESWLKVKKDYIEGIGDSLDLVPIGAWHGMGRKAAWWSPILLALYDEDTGTYQAVCKCISGFTDKEYKSQRFERFVEGSATCYSARTEACRHEYETGGLIPDVWFEPTEVWEVRGADITLSPNYTAALGLVSPERGLSLRFPRFLGRREDKGVEQATTPQQLANLYWKQEDGGTTRAVEGQEGKDEEEIEDAEEKEEDNAQQIVVLDDSDEAASQR